MAHAVSNSSSSRQAAARWAMAGRAIKAIHFPPEKVGSLRKKQPTPSVALLARGDTALLATKFWRVDYSTACARGARRPAVRAVRQSAARHDARSLTAVLLAAYCILITIRGSSRVLGHAIGLVHIGSARRSRHRAVVAVAIQRDHAHQALLESGCRARPDRGTPRGRPLRACSHACKCSTTLRAVPARMASSPQPVQAAAP